MVLVCIFLRIVLGHAPQYDPQKNTSSLVFFIDGLCYNCRKAACCIQCRHIKSDWSAGAAREIAAIRVQEKNAIVSPLFAVLQYA